MCYGSQRTPVSVFDARYIDYAFTVGDYARSVPGTIHTLFEFEISAGILPVVGTWWAPADTLPDSCANHISNNPKFHVTITKTWTTQNYFLITETWLDLLNFENFEVPTPSPLLETASGRQVRCSRWKFDLVVSRHIMNNRRG